MARRPVGMRSAGPEAALQGAALAGTRARRSLPLPGGWLPWSRRSSKRLCGRAFFAVAAAAAAAYLAVSGGCRRHTAAPPERREPQEPWPVLPARLPSAFAGAAASVPGGIGGYLFETGYIWPVLGFLLAIAILWRGRHRPGGGYGKYAAGSGAVSGGVLPLGSAAAPAANLAFDVMDRNHDGVITRQEFHQALAPEAMPVMPAPNQSFNAMYGAVYDETAAVGPLAAPGSPTTPGAGSPRGLAARLGLMTAQKVIEIERMLVQELEESLVVKMGYLASLFHSWRSEASVLRVGRQFEEEFTAQKDEWEKYVTDQQAGCEAKLESFARTDDKRTARWRRSLAVLMDQWSLGDGNGLKHAALASWGEWTRRRSNLRAQRQRVHSVVVAWAEGDSRGRMHVCFKNWAHFAAHAREVRQKHVELEAAKQSWSLFLEEESTKNEAKIEEAALAGEAWRARAREEVALILDIWERGDYAGLQLHVLRAWKQFSASARRAKRQKQSVRVALAQFCSTQTSGSLHMCLVSWRSLARHSVHMAREKETWEDFLSGEQARRQEDLQAYEDAERRRLQRARRTVESALRQWTMGQETGTCSEVLQAWREYAAQIGARSRRCNAVRDRLVVWLEGDAVGIAHSCFIHWKAQATHGRLARLREQTEQKQKQTWEELLSDERRRHQELEEDFRAASKRRQDQAHALVEFSLLRWELGDDVGLALRVLRGWALWSAAARRLSAKRQAVHVALLQALEGDGKATLHSCVLNWQMWTKRTLLVRSGEARLAEEKRRWEALLQDQREGHRQSMQSAQSSAELRKARAHEATQVMLRQWRQGDMVGILSAVLTVWKRQKDESANSAWRRQSAHLALLRFCGGDRRSLAQMCTLQWKHWAKQEALHRKEVADRDRQIVQLEGRMRSMLSREQLRLLKYARMMGSGEVLVTVSACFCGWRLHVGGLRAQETRRRLEVTLEERRRTHDLAVTRRQKMVIASLEALGLKDSYGLVLECFLCWSYQYQKAKQEWAIKLTHSKVVAKYTWYAQCYFLRADNTAVLAACFWELLREAKVQLHAKEREKQARMLEEVSILILQVQEDRNSLEQQLNAVYRQIDNLTETMQKELKTKEELAADLREAYDQLRRRNTHKTKDVTQASLTMHSHTRSTSGTPSSRRSDVLPHLPAAYLRSNSGSPGLLGGHLEEEAEDTAP